MWDLFESFSLDIGDAPTLGLFDYKNQGYVNINIFGTTACLFTIILSFTGLDLPIWG